MGDRLLLLEPIGGIAGDMFLAAAIDLGVSPEEIARALSGLGLPGWRFEVSRAERHAITGTHLEVVVDAHAHHHHTSLREIRAMIEACGTMSPRAKDRAQRIFTVIGEAEARIHGIPVEDVHFHEVGAVDSIVDVCGAAVVLDLLGDPEVLALAPPLGSGSVRAAHGQMPVPAPATLEILRDVPVRFEGVGELTTPTGAGILKAVARIGAFGEVVVDRVGFGVGTKDFRDRPNVLRASLARASAQVPKADGMWIVEANVDDCSPQLLGALIERMLEQGAKDAFVTPVVMKKSRPGHLFTVIASADRLDALIDVLLSESTTIGVRFRPTERVELERRFETVETPYGPVKMKIASRDGKVLNAAPEFEDCRERARAHEVPIKAVQAAALIAWKGE